MQVKMKPETIARRKLERQREIEANRKDRRRRLKAKADSDPEGANSIWAEMLRELDEIISLENS